MGDETEEGGRLCRTCVSAPMTHVLLVGGGHAHVEVVRRLGRSKPPGVQLTLLSRDPVALYSGMLPGHVAGRYRIEEIGIDLARLCAGAGATFRTATVTGIDPVRHIVGTTDGGEHAYDLLSLAVGSAPRLPRADAGGLPVKPIEGFLAALAALPGRFAALGCTARLAVVGAGPAGVEIACALASRFAAAGTPVEIVLVTASPEILPGRSVRARRLVAAALRRHGIVVVSSFTVVDHRDGCLVEAGGRGLPVDEVVWATPSTAPAWLAGTGLALDASGFVLVDTALRSLSHPTVFAAGDLAALPGGAPKAGVFAVRQGPVLAENLCRAVAGRPLRRYLPQRRWLALISTADGRAVADKYGLSVGGRWVWRWKDRSDRRFLARYAAAS